MTRSELTNILKKLKLDTAYTDRWFVLYGDVNPNDYGATYVKFSEKSFECTAVYPATHDDEDCDLVTSWLVSDYSGSFEDLINIIDRYRETYTSAELPSLTNFITGMIDTYIGDGLGHSDSSNTTEPHYLFNFNSQVPSLLFSLG